MKNQTFRFVYALAVLTLACAVGVHGQERCGQQGQRVCGKQDCELKAGWAIIVYPYESCPAPCVEGLAPSGGVCSLPVGGCDIGCKMSRITAKLGAPSGISPGKTMYCFGTPYDPYGGHRVSRSDLGLNVEDKSVTIDIGGEGLYVDDAGRQWGSDQAINLNCSLNRTTYGDTSKPIQHLVFGFVQNMPFTERFADTILINNTPIVVSEIERVIRPGGRISIAYVSENTHLVETMIAHMCLSPAVSAFGFYNFVQLDVPTDFNYLQPKNCKPRDEL
jgi:hypothetical protein